MVRGASEDEVVSPASAVVGVQQQQQQQQRSPPPPPQLAVPARQQQQRKQNRRPNKGGKRRTRRRQQHRRRNHKEDEAAFERAVEQFIPSSVQNIIKDSGKRLLRTVLANNLPQKKKSGGQRRQQSLGASWRTIVSSNIYPNFAPQVVTGHLVAQWVNTVAITFAWIGVGSMYLANSVSTGRSGDGVLANEDDEEFEDDQEDEEEEGGDLLEMLVPSRDKVAFVLRELATAAETWGHDEL